MQQNKESRANLTPRKEDFMEMLLDSGKKAGSNDAELAGHALNIFMEGFETSSHVLAFVFYELARNSSVQERLHEDTIKVLAKHNNEFTYEALQEMKYLDAVVHGEFRNAAHFSCVTIFFFIFQNI